MHTQNHNNDEFRTGAFSGLVACILVIALTAMAFGALTPRDPPQRDYGQVSAPESSPSIAPGFGS